MPRKKAKIEEIYKEMDEITHVLSRPGMYVGSTKEESRQVFIYDQDEGKMTLKEVNYIPAMLKMFDEILSNSCDEFRRDTNLGLNKVEVTVNKEGTIVVRDNGGMPVEIHKEAKCYVPEFVFGRLRTSSNYNDDEDRQLVGTNGVGSSLSNIFSSSFIIDTADGKKSFHRSWSNNMKELNDDLKIKASKDHFTQTTFTPDFSKFEIDYTEFQEDFVNLIEKRCIDAAAGNIGLKVIFNYNVEGKKVYSSNWKFKKFDEYIELFDDFIDLGTKLSFDDGEKHVWIFPGSNVNVGFVDGAECSRGTHIGAIRYPINKMIQQFMLKKHKIDVTLHAVETKYSVFCTVNVTNPAYDSQTKECLTTPADKFSKDPDYKFTVPEDFLKKCTKSEIIDLVKDWYAQKQTVEDNARIRKMNRESGKLLRSDKFINCASKKPEEKQLWIFEGDSAASGFRQGRNPMTQAGYLMRGVPLNTIGMKPVQIMKNQVLNDIVKILGLKWGEYNKKEDLKFSKIVISTDMDFDGHKIAALLMVFFNHFPELFEQQMICRIMSPIVIATKGKQEMKFYSLEELRKNQNKYKTWSFKYVKGLGTQSQAQYREMMRSDKFQYFTKDNLADTMLMKWFGKGIASTRKDMLKEDVEAED